MLLPLGLLFVGAVLVLNGFWMLGRVSEREVIVINLGVTVITGAVALLTLLQGLTPEAVRSAALTLLFSMTYGWVAWNRITGCDGRGLGWFSLFVALSVLPEGVLQLSAAASGMDVWLALAWISWAGLWFAYFLSLSLRWQIERFVAWLTLGNGVITAWAPALVLLYGARL